jgi:large subunit ribosomal protein L4
MRANQRQTIAHAKGRGEVSGGGKKPWRQKGTGRARHGSIRSPLWRKGGVTHGPIKEKVFARRLNKKVRRKALVMVLSGKVQRQLFYVVEDKSLDGFNKTKTVQKFAEQFLKEGKRLHRGLLIHSFPEAQSGRGVRNLPYLQWLPVQGVNLLDCVNTTYMIISESSVQSLTSLLKHA